jgi:hypothetical protein
MIDKDELDAKLKGFRELVCRETPRFFDSESFLEAISEVSCNPDSYLVLRIEIRNCLNEIKFGVSKGKNKL